MCLPSGFFSLVAPLLFAMCSAPQAELPVQPGKIELRVELRQGTRWQPVDVHTVFRSKDEIRFSFRSSFSGYLKVVNRSNDGQTTSLFPFSDAKQMGQVESNTDYIIPGAKGSFVVGGKAGFDLTEWLVSSIPLEGDWQLTGGLPETNTLLPRCQEEELQARGSCLDKRAGPSPTARSVSQNSHPSEDAPLVSRDLSFGSRDLSAVITVPDTSRKLVVYEFRVAHR